MIKRPFK